MSTKKVKIELTVPQLAMVERSVRYALQADEPFDHQRGEVQTAERALWEIQRVLDNATIWKEASA